VEVRGGGDTFYARVGAELQLGSMAHVQAEMRTIDGNISNISLDLFSTQAIYALLLLLLLFVCLFSCLLFA